MPSIALPDGRRVAYEEYGSPDGHPVVYCHGTPGSRLSAALLDDQSVRVIAPDRPGVGESDPDSDPPATADGLLTAWRKDVRSLADELGLDSFGVVGFSGGAPFALAAGAAPEATAVAAVAPSGPPETGDDDALTLLSRYAPTVVRGLFSVQRFVVGRRPASALSLYTDAAPESLSLPDGADPVELLADDYLAATAQGGRRPARELSLLADPWDLPDPGVPVGVWYGKNDENVPPSMAEAVADRVADEVTAVSGDHLETLCESRSEAVAFVSPSA